MVNAVVTGPLLLEDGILATLCLNSKKITNIFIGLNRVISAVQIMNMYKIHSNNKFECINSSSVELVSILPKLITSQRA